MKKKNPDAYADVICLMAGIDVEELAILEPGYAVELFMHGLTVNKVYDLKDFCERLNYHATV